MPRRAAAGKPPTYSFVEVPDAAKRPPLGDSMVEVPATRQRWLGMKDELKGLCDEAVRRRALKLLSRGARPRTASAARRTGSVQKLSYRQYIQWCQKLRKHHEA